MMSVAESRNSQPMRVSRLGAMVNGRRVRT